MKNNLREMSKNSLQFKKKIEVEPGVCKVKLCASPAVDKGKHNSSKGFCIEHRAVHRLQEERASKKIERKISRWREEEDNEPKGSIWTVQGGLPS
jgi:hypothetical protein